MNKQKVTLPTSKWGTIKSKYRPESNYVQNDEQTAGSSNYITNNTGALEKRPTDVLYNSTALTKPTDQYEAIFTSGVHNLLIMDEGILKYSTGNGIFTSVQAGYTPSASMEYSMYQSRVYFDNGVDQPGVYDLVASYGGVTYSVPRVKPMGAQTPMTAPLFGANSVGGSVPVGGHTYVITYLYYEDEESNGGPASTLNTVVSPNQTVNLNTIPIGGYGVTARNIYRDNGDGIYLLVGTLEDNTTTVFVDTEAVGTIPIPTSNNLPPVFAYITLNLSRNWVAGVIGTPTILYWSLPDFPDIYDPNNFTICNPKDPITGLVTFQGITTVFNRHSFGQILGNTDDTFYYQEVPGSVGCVDNRSIQIRTLNGVPVLIWLSDRGFYKFDGSSVTYISDAIEDLVNFNLQQVNFTTGSNSQSTQADYAAGTLSPSIDINSNPNTITVLNPEEVWQAEADWEGGSSLTNIKTADGTNQLKVPTAFAPSLASGTLGGDAMISGTQIVLPIVANNTGQQLGDPGDYATWNVTVGGVFTGTVGFAYPITPTANGTLTSVDFNFGLSVSGVTFQVRVWADALGSPGAILYSGSTRTSVGNSEPDGIPVTETVNISVNAGTTYWFGVVTTAPSNNHIITFKPVTFSGGAPKVFNGINGNNFWQSGGYTPYGIPSNPDSVTWHFAQTPEPDSGTWSSPIYDSGSIGSAMADGLTVSGTYPVNCSATIYVDMSNDPTMNTGITTFSQANPNGLYFIGLTGNRYWRLRWTIVTTDNRTTPSVGVPSMTFFTTGTWISAPINCTTDVTSYSGIQVTDNIPSGTSIAITVATSADNITYSSYGPVGSAVVRQWVKIKIVLTADIFDLSTPSVSFLMFSWLQTSTIISSIIDIGQVPSGWGVFQDVALANGGTFQFYMRSASTSGGIPAATFYPVYNGVFPPSGVVPLEFTQWKIVFTSSANNLPTVSGITVNWFIGSSQSPIRAASLFFNKTYYLSAATIGSLTNDVVIVWDFEDLWRIFYQVNIAAMSLFYNEPFYCDAVRENVYQWLIAPTGTGTAIAMDVRTKAFDLGNINILKNIRSLRVTGINTGTTIHSYYSVDRGVTWIEMLNVNGALGYTTTTDGNKFSQYFVADYSSDAVLVSGNTVMFRVTSTDAFPCSILGLEPVVYTRSGKYLEIQT